MLCQLCLLTLGEHLEDYKHIPVVSFKSKQRSMLEGIKPKEINCM